jgi:Tfp pilus assembly protein PilZ
MRERQYQRFIVEGMDIHAKTLFAAEVDVLNIGFGGACISGTRRLSIGGEYVLKIEGKENPITLNCIVVWEKLSGNVKKPGGELVPIYRAGVQFKESISPMLGKLLDFIEENAAEKEKRLKGIRVKILPEKATIKYPKTYLVKKLSLGGFLIAADEPLPVEEQLHMELSLPGQPTINFLGRVASCLETTSTNVKCFDIGVAFAEIPNGDKTRLSAFVNRLQESA